MASDKSKSKSPKGGSKNKFGGGKKKETHGKDDMRLNMDKQNAFNVIEQEMHNINDIGHDIWRYAETAGKEFLSCKRIVDFLKNKGFRMSSACNDFDTAFRAEFGIGEDGGASHPNIAFLCEYSADTTRGHCRGHNLVTATSLAAAIGLQRVIGFSKVPLGKVTVIGCPSNQTKTAKKDMLDAGCFGGIDFILAVYPANFTCLQPKFNASLKYHVSFQGRSPNSGIEPWEVANPVNAVVLTQQNLAAHRATFCHDWSLNAVIPNAGDDPCNQPEKASLLYEMKAPVFHGIKILNDKLKQCLDGASQASGCKYSDTIVGQPMPPNISLNQFVELYRKNAKLNGFTFYTEHDEVLLEPDDIGFISQFIPTFKVFCYAGSSAAVGSDEFNRYCGSSEAEYLNILQGKCLAMMAVDLFKENETMAGVLDAHEKVMSETKDRSFSDQIIKAFLSYPATPRNSEDNDD